ncbi:hypothetical protein [Micromonospora sp. KC606]|nr:hypothetical protein [Micromonospora sp. KC606]
MPGDTLRRGYRDDGLLLDLLTTSIDAGFDTDEVFSPLVSRLVARTG